MSGLVNPFSVAVAGPWTITIAAGKTTADLTNYPVFLNLADMPAAFWSSVTSNGSNIRVKQSGSLIPIDLVKIDSGAKTGVLFFKAGTLATASDNIFTLDLTGSGLLANNDTNGRNAVWSAFDWVWLGTSNTDVTDRTGGADGTITNSSLGVMNNHAGFALGASCGVDFVPSASQADFITFASRTARSVFTLGCGAEFNGTVAASRYAMTYADGAGSVNLGARQRNPTDQISVFDINNSWIATDVAPFLTGATSTRMHAAYNGSTSRRWSTDGVTRQTSGAITAQTTRTDYTVGSSVNQAEGHGGRVGYCYARPEVLPAAYIAAEFSNLNAPSSFYGVT